MNDKITVMLIPEKGTKHFSFTLSLINIKYLSVIVFILASFFGYAIFDYANLLIQRDSFYKNERETQLVRSEAQLLSQKLETLKKSLTHVQDFAKQIGDIVNLRISTVKSKTGIGPQKVVDKFDTNKNAVEEPVHFFGISTDKLTFNLVFSKINKLEVDSNLRAKQLQELLNTLREKKSLLSSIPTIMPTKGWITSGFGLRVSPFTGETIQHRGVDIAAKVGEPVYATADGVVVVSELKPDFGNIVIIAHYDNGIVSKYAHNSENLVTVGQRVSRGDQIASVGMTGNTTGPHLHYEVWVNGQVENPINFIVDSEGMSF